MDIRFATPDLRSLDALRSEVLIAGYSSDERPPRGLAGLADWRLCGEISEFISRGSVTGSLGEVVLLPAQKHFSFDKLILLGIGTQAEFTEEVYGQLLADLMKLLDGLHVKGVVAELPGRHENWIAPERAVELLVDKAQHYPALDSWTLLENVEAQKEVSRRMIQDRRLRL